MPNRIDDFVPYRLLLFFEDRLRLISTALGYNCDVAVYTEWNEFRNSEAKFKAWFDASGSDTPVNFVGGGGRVNQAITITVVAVATYETEHPRRLAMSLEQDMRTALHSGFSEINGYVGRGCSARFGRSTHDGGRLSPEKQAGFDLPVTFTWSQNSDW